MMNTSLKEWFSIVAKAVKSNKVRRGVIPILVFNATGATICVGLKSAVAANLRRASMNCLEHHPKEGRG